MNILNRSKKPLQLSLQDDRFQIRVGPPGSPNAKVVNAVFDISRTDPDWWKSLDPALQRALAYPDQAAIRTSEEENVFVFVPTAGPAVISRAAALHDRELSATPIVIRQQRLASGARQRKSEPWRSTIRSARSPSISGVRTMVGASSRSSRWLS